MKPVPIVGYHDMLCSIVLCIDNGHMVTMIEYKARHEYSGATFDVVVVHRDEIMT